MNKHIMIATPAYSGNVSVSYAVSLADTIVLLKDHKIGYSTLLTSSGSLLVAERNRILEAFWQSEATHLLCIDADLGWDPNGVLSLLEADKDIAAGVYPARADASGKQFWFNFRAKLNPNGSIVQDGLLLGMEYIPAGFMLISRQALEKMRNHFPELYYSPKNEQNDRESTFCLFNTEVWEGEFWGEDYVFCRRAREAGLEIWVDPRIYFDHNRIRGLLLNVLSDAPDKAEPLVVNDYHKAA